MAAAPDPLTDTRLNIASPSDQPRLLQVTGGVADLLTDPKTGAGRTSQALQGEHLLIHAESGGFGLAQCQRDRYCGWVSLDQLSRPARETTHRIHALRTFVFPQPDLKTPPSHTLSLGAEIVVDGEQDRFAHSADGGWVPLQHISPKLDFENDPAAVAERFIGAPYLWGGRESLGLDCSGLTIAAYGACGVLLPRDSDMQFAWSGENISGWDAPGALQRGDLVFWKGHVGIMTDAEQMVHANAYHMATAKEPLAGAITRIANRYGEPIGARRINLMSARKRPDWMGA